MLKTLFQYFKNHKELFIIDMLCALTVATVDLAFPLVSRHGMYHILPNKEYGIFFALMITMGSFYILRAICYYLMTYLGHTFGVLVEADIRADLFRHLQELDFEFYDRNRTGKLMSRLTGDLFEITELAHHGPEDLLISVLTIVGSLIFMFVMEWRLALIVAVLIPVFLLIVMKCRKNMAKASKEVKVKLASINSDIETSISGIKTSKAFNNEDVERNRFSKSNETFVEAKASYYKAMGTFSGSQEFFLGIMPCIVIGAGGALMMSDHLDYIELITFTLFVNTFITPIRKMSNFAEIFANGMAGLRRFHEIMAIKPEVEEKENAIDFIVKEGKIEIEDISFSYRNDSRVIDHLSIDIRGGETLAVVGHSGGGKTTLCQLIPRFYDVTGGSIKIDGKDVRDVTKDSLRRNIGIVQQDVFIFADTIFENIRYGKPEATFEEVVEAAKKAEIYEDILKMPEGFETYVGERGAQLSGGQKQRISIARIFLKNPKILILDEATSALDTVTEERIQHSFDELKEGRTTLVIAHRLATVRNAHRIIVLEGGKIVEEGSHSELLNLKGEYARLCSTQKIV